MKINKDNLLRNVDATFLVEVLKESINLYNKGEDLIVNVTDLAKDESAYCTDVGYEVLSRFEDLLESKLEMIYRFFDGRVSGYPEMNRRVNDLLSLFEKNKRVIEPLLDEFVPLTFKEFNFVLNNLKAMIGHLCIFIRKQYELDSYLEGQAPEFSLEVYMNSNGFDKAWVESLVVKLAARAIAYRPRIAIFDEYPEFEQPFFDRVGDEFYDLEYLNVQYVLDVVNDNLSVEDLLTLLNEK